MREDQQTTMRLYTKLKNILKEPLLRAVSAKWFLIPYYTDEQRLRIVRTGDPVRYGALDLAFGQLVKDGIPGPLAECGVYKGALSKYIHDQFPDRTLYLFDTFRGFDPRDSNTQGDDRFRDTSLESVLENIEDTRNITVRKGYFPETAAGLEDKRFSFVMIDFDKYEPTMEALKFFYPRVNPGGFIVVHDYSNPESDWACSKALNEFLVGRPEKPVLIPDGWGTALFRKF